MVNNLQAKILKNQQILPEFYCMEIECAEIVQAAKPGQFVMLKVGDGTDPFLKRPLGINQIKETSLEVIYQIKGRGTQMLATQKVGNKIEILGPIGNGWQITGKEKRVLIVGGGAGIAPLLPLAQQLQRNATEVYAVLGATTKDKLINEADFAKLCVVCNLCTDDGSCGKKGLVIDGLGALLRHDFEMIYCCGPEKMMAGVAAIAWAGQVPCQVSLEERMGCGLGTCMGCVCAVKNPNGSTVYKRVCQDGPVFDSREVVFNG